MVDQNYFSKIHGGIFELGGDENTGTLYHWIWYNSNTSDKIGEFLVSKGFKKDRFTSFTNASAKGIFTRVEMRVNNDPNEIKFFVEYFDGNGNCNNQVYTKSEIKKSINILTCITIIGSFASVVGVIIGILCLCE